MRSSTCRTIEICLQLYPISLKRHRCLYRIDRDLDNERSHCLFSDEIGSSCKQISIVLHVDDLMVTSESQTDLDNFGLYLKSAYPETRTNSGERLDYAAQYSILYVVRQHVWVYDRCMTYLEVRVEASILGGH